MNPKNFSIETYTIQATCFFALSCFFEGIEGYMTGSVTFYPNFNGNPFPVQGKTVGLLDFPQELNSWAVAQTHQSSFPIWQTDEGLGFS